MAESTQYKERNLNMFHEEMESKTTKKETFNVENTEIGITFSTESIALQIDDDIAAIQAETIEAVANAMQNSTASTEDSKPCNLDIEASLNNTLETCGSDGASSELSYYHVSLTECQLGVDIDGNSSSDSRLVVAMGEELMAKILFAIDVLISRVGAFIKKANEAIERGTEHGYISAEFYHCLASKYKSKIAALEWKAKEIKIAMNRVLTAMDECQNYVELAEEISDEALEEFRRTKLAAWWWTYKGRAAIIVSLKKEHSALLMMRKIWNSVREDIQYAPFRGTVESDVEETQKCQNRDRQTKIAHIVVTLVGIALLSTMCLFNAGSNSFNTILALGLLTTGWCAGYWMYMYYKFLKGRNNEQISKEDYLQMIEDLFLENNDRRLEIVRTRLLKYNIIVDSDAESDTDSAETAVVGDVSQ